MLNRAIGVFVACELLASASPAAAELLKVSVPQRGQLPAGIALHCTIRSSSILPAMASAKVLNQGSETRPADQTIGAIMHMRKLAT